MKIIIIKKFQVFMEMDQEKSLIVQMTTIK